jgi:hypothetical protein
VNLTPRVFVIPQRADYEENLEPAPPLIHVQDEAHFLFNDSNTIPFKSKRSLSFVPTLDNGNQSSDSNQADQQSQLFESIPPYYSATILSPVEEEDETTSGIAFSLSDQNSLSKKVSLGDKDDSTGFLTIDDDEQKPPFKSDISQEMLSTPLSKTAAVISDTLQSVEAPPPEQIDQSRRVMFLLNIKPKYFVFNSGYYSHTTIVFILK